MSGDAAIRAIIEKYGTGSPGQNADGVQSRARRIG